jgi:hypothetical protein
MTNVRIQIIENITKPNTLFSHHHFNIQYPINEFTYWKRKKNIPKFSSFKKILQNNLVVSLQQNETILPGKI